MPRFAQDEGAHISPCEWTNIHGTDKTFEIHGGDMKFEKIDPATNDGKEYKAVLTGLEIRNTEG